MRQNVFQINGLTLLLDLHECDRALLQDCDKQYKMLLELPGKIGMTPIAAPQIARWDTPLCQEPMEWGYSGTVLFAESHVYFHTWPEIRFVLCDLTSCKNFDVPFVIEEIKKVFGAKIAVPVKVGRGYGHDARRPSADGASMEPAACLDEARREEVYVMGSKDL